MAQQKLSNEDAQALRSVGLDPRYAGITRESELEGLALADEGDDDTPPGLFAAFPEFEQRVRDATTVDALAQIVFELFKEGVSVEELTTPILKLTHLRDGQVPAAVTLAARQLVSLGMCLPGSTEARAEEAQLRAIGLDADHAGCSSESEFRIIQARKARRERMKN